MCTVSYLPLPGGYLITSNRDESPSRNAVGIEHLRTPNGTIIFPKDPVAGGSWIAVTDRGRTACLLNGAYVPFAPDPKYTHSRGRVLLDAIDQQSMDWLTESYDLHSTAPFTLVMAEGDTLVEYVWDGSTLHRQVLSCRETHFWSSVTLYPEEVRQWRKSLFHRWLPQQHEYLQDAIMEFHRYGTKEDNWNGFVMNRNERVRTLSISSVLKQEHTVRFRHDDLLTGQSHREVFDINAYHVAPH